MHRTILSAFLLLLFVSSTRAFQWNDSLSNVLHPTQECLQNPPVNIFYYSFLFTADSPLVDYCGMNHSRSCSSLCDNNVIVETKKVSNLDSLTGLVNYCLYCNGSESSTFRQKLVNSECSGFSIGNGNIGPKLYEIMEYHCGENALPLIDMNFVYSDYFRRNLYTQSSMNASIEWSTFISLYFSNYLVSNYQNTAPPLKIPTLCWCNYQESTESQVFSHQCFDVNSNFLMYSYRTSPIILTIVFFLLFIIHFIFLVIPKFTERFIKLNKALTFDHEFKSPSFKVKFTFFHFIDISVHPPILFSFTLFLEFIESLVRVLSNYAFFYDYYLNYYVGIFRGLGGICGLCGYSSLVILWSHSIDLANTNKEPPTFLSKINLIILGIVYIGVIISLIIMFSLFLAIDQNTSYIVLSISTLIYTLIFVLGFIIYGLRIIHKLRQQRNNIWEYKFTKFIVSLSIISTVVWILCILIFITYSLGFDVFGSFFGNARNLIIDLCIIAMTVLSSYITINEDGFKRIYGEKLYQVITCDVSELKVYSNRKRKMVSMQSKELESVGKNTVVEKSIVIGE